MALKTNNGQVHFILSAARGTWLLVENNPSLLIRGGIGGQWQEQLPLSRNYNSGILPQWPPSDAASHEQQSQTLQFERELLCLGH